MSVADRQPPRHLALVPPSPVVGQAQIQFEVGWLGAAEWKRHRELDRGIAGRGVQFDRELGDGSTAGHQTRREWFLHEIVLHPAFEVCEWNRLDGLGPQRPPLRAVIAFGEQRERHIADVEFAVDSDSQ